MNARKSAAPIRDATSGEPPLALEVVGTAATELLIGLYAAMSPGQALEGSWASRDAASEAPATRAAIAAIGGEAGEIWLHLLGLALDSGAADADALIDAVEATAPDELRRYLVGVHVPAWQRLVGRETLAAGAAGDPTAIQALLGHPRYYGGRASASLSELLPLPPAETKARLLDTLRAFADEVFLSVQDGLARRLAAEADNKRALAATCSPEELIDLAAGGYRYEREPELDRVVLVPHFAARPWLLLCQHRASRVICYAVAEETSDPEQLVALGRALGDEKRLAILSRLRRGDASLQELADEIGLARSTTHHHLAQLRRARLIALRGNAGGYAYTLDAAGFREAERLVGRFPAS